MEIQPLYIDVSRYSEQSQRFRLVGLYLEVLNMSYQKQVEVFWREASGKWRQQAAQFKSPLHQRYELWYAELKLADSGLKQGAGNGEFYLRYHGESGEFINSNQGLNFAIPKQNGIYLRSRLSFCQLELSAQPDEGEFHSISVAVAPNLAMEQVVVHWTVDDWRSVKQTPCHSRRVKTTDLKRQQARLWKAKLKHQNAFRLQYCLEYRLRDQTLWDNNGGANYCLSHKPLKLMILNLHCYQEDRQLEKFAQISKAIDDLKVDVVCLQEVAEHWNHGYGDWTSNAARIINDALEKPYHLYTDWSHLGFDKYREGVGILSRYPMRQQEARYVSESHDAYSIHSRKVVFAQIQVPGIGSLNVFSAHLSWWEDGFEGQFKNLSEWAEQRQQPSVKATLLCGDFNIAAGSKGYEWVVNQKQFEDQFLAVNNQGAFEQVFRVNDPHWRNYLGDDYRIDYIFMNKSGKLQIKSGEVIFTDNYYGRVSDHCGYVMTFEPKMTE